MASTTSLAHRLYTGELSYDYVGKRKLWYTVSAVVLGLSLLALALFGLNLSIDFKGGSEFSVPTRVSASTVEDYRSAVRSIDLPDNDDIKVNTVGDNQVRIQTRTLSAEEITKVTASLATKAGVDPAQVTNNLIGASWGQQITQQGLIALGVFLVLVSLMIWAYFRDWKMAVAAIVALIHDLILTLGVFAVLQFPFSPASLIGLLTILGYSLYDTVVVFDKIRENVRDITHQNRTYSEAATRAVNQVLVRSINTTIIGVLPVAALLIAGTFILGVGPLKDLGLALFVGMIAGAYSSIFIAAPLLAQMREAEPELTEHRERLARRAARRSPGATAEPVKTTVLASTAAPVAPESVGVVSAAELRERTQPIRSPRSARKKDQR